MTDQKPDSSRAPAQEPETNSTAAGAAGGAAGTGSQVSIEDPEVVAETIEADPAIVTAKTIKEAILAVPNARALMVAAAVRCLGAKRLMFDRASKEVVKVDDGSTIMKAVAWLAAYSDGLPIQHTVNVNMDANKEMPMVEMMAKSPALRAAVRKQLEQAEAAAAVESGSVQKTVSDSGAVAPAVTG